MTKFNRIWLAPLALTALAACGSGKASESAPSTTAPAASECTNGAIEWRKVADYTKPAGTFVNVQYRCTDGQWTATGERQEDTAAPTTTTTVATTLSRDAKVAVQRCIDEAGSFTLGADISIGIADTHEVIETCDEASRQIDVDLPAVGDTPGNRLKVLIAKRSLDIAEAKVASFGDKQAAKDKLDNLTNSSFQWQADMKAALAEAS